MVRHQSCQCCGLWPGGPGPAEGVLEPGCAKVHLGPASSRHRQANSGSWPAGVNFLKLSDVSYHSESPQMKKDVLRRAGGLGSSLSSYLTQEVLLFLDPLPPCPTYSTQHKVKRIGLWEAGCAIIVLYIVKYWAGKKDYYGQPGCRDLYRERT